MKRKIISYEPYLKKIARKLHQSMTFSEVKLWNELRNRQMMGYDFDRQRPISKYIVDFYCKDIFVIIEIDGITHDDDTVAINDEKRQKELENLGLYFLRFGALDVVRDIVNVARTIENWIFDHEDTNGVPENVKRYRSSKGPTPTTPRE